MKRGFTLIELIVVIVLIGILSVVVGPKIFTSGYKASGEVAKFITVARFLQHKSMITGTKYGIKFEHSRYCGIDVNGNTVIVPSEDNPCISVSDSISAKEGSLPLKELYFDFMGRPIRDNGSLFDKEIVINIDGKMVYITPNAGGVYEP